MMAGYSQRWTWTRALALLGLGLGVQAAQAMTWTRIGETPDVALFVSRPSIEKEDSIRRVWEMQDLKAPDADGVMSRRYLNEYDCQYKMHRMSQVSSFSGPKLSGKQLFNLDETGYWRKISPNGLFVLTYIAVCVE
ncbi:MAG: hypothetical protein KAY21_01425 [Limnohabitans sp.]|nr:hypothetical protein [Limnohabitans sp.]